MPNCWSWIRTVWWLISTPTPVPIRLTAVSMPWGASKNPSTWRKACCGLSASACCWAVGGELFWWQEQSTRKDSDAAVSRALEHVEVESADGTDRDSSAGRAGKIRLSPMARPRLSSLRARSNRNWRTATTAPAADTATSASQPAPVAEPSCGGGPGCCSARRTRQRGVAERDAGG